MNVTKFGKFLVDQGFATEEGIIKALNIQRKREVIPIGEIALQRDLLTVKQIYEILNKQTPESNKKFGEIAIELGYLTKEEVFRLIKIQDRFRLPIGEILVELGELDKLALKKALDSFYAQTSPQNFFCKVCDAVLEADEAESHGENCPKCGGRLLSKSNNATLETVKPQEEKDIQGIDLPQNTPFLLVRHNCPICGNENRLVTVKQSLFFYHGKDVDMQPINCEWHNKEFCNISPNLYNIWQCSKCFFTASKHYFDNPVLDTNIHMFDFRQMLVSKYKSNPHTLTVVNTLKGSVHPMNMTPFIAIKYYLLAIYLLEQIEKVKTKDSIPLGRYYLNLAWLYRDLHQTESQKKIAEQVLDELNNKLGNIWSAIPKNEQEALVQALKYYDTAFYSSSFIEAKHIEHNILQIMGRINLKLDNKDIARKDFNESIKYAEEYTEALTAKLAKNKNNSVKAKTIKQKINKTKNFIGETKALIAKYISD